MQNLLDRIDISKKAHSEYLEFAHEVAQMLLAQNINPADIKDEDAIVHADKTLEIFVIVCGLKYSMRIEPDEWRFATANG